jgi:hypothetical protein
MGIPVLILGESGSGKSTSLRNFNPEDVGVFNVAGKPLPFREGRNFKIVNNATYQKIAQAFGKPTKKVYVIDDSQYLMAFEFFDHARETGYQKFVNLGLNFQSLIRMCQENLPEDTIVYFLQHTETTADGKTKCKTIGKMLDEKLTVEGLFSIVLLCDVLDKRHVFITQSDGTTTAKSPMGMFPETIDNDLEYVDETIRDYYGYKPLRNKEEQ